MKRSQSCMRMELTMDHGLVSPLRSRVNQINTMELEPSRRVLVQYAIRERRALGAGGPSHELELGAGAAERAAPYEPSPIGGAINRGSAQPCGIVSRAAPLASGPRG